ncbi:hypothetical protein [Anabaena sp. 4-3]|uniref:hypothetical protein n=1 Tax=Anabaena sp. 4-3 TaxID=1811979 RepID=UPI0012E83BCF|nr:hypothetical protein [Anabaena sp. 4-3]
MPKSSLPSVQQGLFRSLGGWEIRLVEDWESWQEWLERNNSFRYCPMWGEPAYTVRKEQGTKGKASYWYAYRKESGKLAKVYVGLSEALTVQNLEAIALQLTQKLQIKVTDKLPVTKTQVTDMATENQYVTKGKVTEREELSVTKDEVEKLQREIERLQNELQISVGK